MQMTIFIDKKNPGYHPFFDLYSKSDPHLTTASQPTELARHIGGWMSHWESNGSPDPPLPWHTEFIIDGQPWHGTVQKTIRKTVYLLKQSTNNRYSDDDDDAGAKRNRSQTWTCRHAGLTGVSDTVSKAPNPQRSHILSKKSNYSNAAPRQYPVDSINASDKTFAKATQTAPAVDLNGITSE